MARKTSEKMTEERRADKVGDRLLVKLSGGRIVVATAKAVVDVVSGHAS